MYICLHVMEYLNVMKYFKSQVDHEKLLKKLVKWCADSPKYNSDNKPFRFMYSIKDQAVENCMSG